MTILLRGKTHLISRIKSLTPLQRFNHNLTEEGIEAQACPEVGYDFLAQQSYVVDKSKWRKLNARYYGLTHSMIPAAPWTVLKLLRAEGFESYLVGGCVRDLLLNRVPKDFDVITTANLKQIKKKFHRSQIVGRRFPICIVYIKGSAIEVSSFETAAKQSQEKEKFLLSQMPRSCDEKDCRRWRNSMHRDFTINSLFFDPFMNRIYDYANGMADLRSLKLRTLIPAQLSFQEDRARILRGIRIAGRLGLSISKDTETAICKLSSSIKSLNKERLMMELNYMLSYGAAESTILLLQRFHLLELFFPFHASYLHKQAGEISVQGSTMLMKLFSSLDKMVSSDRPCDCSLWVGLLAFHQALVFNPQNAFVVWVFASILYCGTQQEGVQFARENAKVQERFVPEISGFSEIKSDEELAEKVSQLASLVQYTVDAFTDEISLSESLSRYLDSPFYDLVFISKKISKHVALFFHMQPCEYGRESFKIDYDLLGKGDLHETRFVLGKVILETLSGGLVRGKEILKEDTKVIKKDHEPTLSDLVKKVNGEGHILLSFDERNQERANQLENINMKQFSEQKINSMKEKVVSIDALMDMAKKQHKVVDTTLVCEEKFHLPLQESDKKQVAVGNELHQHSAKKHGKMVEKVEHHKLCYKETKELFNVIRKCNPSEDKKIKGEEKNIRPPVLQELAKEKTKKLKHGMAKEKTKKLKLAMAKEKSVRSKKQQKVVDAARVCEEKFHLPLQESDKKQVAVGNELHQHRAKKHKKMVEKVEHHELCYKETKELFNVTRNCNPSEDEKIKGEEQNVQPPVLQELAKEKTKKLKHVMAKKKSVRSKKQQKEADKTLVCEENFHLPPQESDKKQVAVGNELHQHRAKKHRKMEEKVVHHELRYKETEELFNVIRKCNPSEDEKIKGEEKNVRPPVLQELVKEKTMKLKHVMTKEKSVRSVLSSLFK